MNERAFRERLALEPRVAGIESLPDELRVAAQRDPALRRIVDERARIDALLDEADRRDGGDALEPSAGFTDAVVEAALRGDRTAGRHLVPLRTKLAAAAGLAAVLAVGLLIQRERSGAPDAGRSEATPADPEMIARLDLFLDDWEAVVEHEETLDLVASLEVAEALEAFPGDEEGDVEEDGPR
ncbi:MAG: hypothetical protein ACF8XB_12390 [Planctomycetota bacterium JB042]